jgi:trans-AT polyketide synthase, acyltransferase and oxidoreductase domains
MIMTTIMFPGQGSQFRGMGKELFKIYRNEVRYASDILGYDVEELCLTDPQKLLGKTQYTQPALYVVNTLGFYELEKTVKADYLIGHSLGEYNALLAAEAFDFATGLKLVQKRGALMAAASGGSMAAVLGIDLLALTQKLKDGGFDDIDIANFNTPSQIVIAGPVDSINKIVVEFDKQKIKIIPLFVSAPFHSRYMKSAADEFSIFLQQFSFSPLKIPVIANSTAKPYANDRIAELLSNQIRASVQWNNSIDFLLTQGVTRFEEVGGVILSKMVGEIKGNYRPPKPDTQVNNAAKEGITASRHLSMKLGSQAFREDYGIRYSYVTGAMYRGIASKELVVCMGNAGMMAFLGTGGVTLNEIESWIKYIQEHLKKGQAYGMNLLHNPSDAAFEMRTVDLYLKYGIKNIEAAAYMQITAALVYFRITGLKKALNGEIICEHKIIAKVSRPEVAEAFMQPAPEKIVNKLLADKLITNEQVQLSKKVPMSHDICVEADSGGHTDRGVSIVLLPAILQLRKEIEKQHQYHQSIRVGLAGGIGTPESIVCAFIMGADFVLTGSINQCTVQAGMSNSVKDILQDINVQDTDYCPAGDMFEIGAKVQVLKKGVLFPARANKLYTIYQQYNSLEEIPEKTIEQLEKNYFKRSIETVWQETKNYYSSNGGQEQITRAEANPKHKMALLFRWYFGYTSKLAFEGDIDKKVNFQVHTGSSMGAFNQWVKGTPLEFWRNRNVDEIAVKLMEGAAELLEQKMLTFYNHNHKC